MSQNEDTRQINSIASETTLWRSSKHPTKQDHEATLAFLEIRKKYDGEFSDKKTSKNVIWRKIVNEMNAMGYYVGDGSEATEKCRQKFANLQSSYVKAKQRKKTTGEGKIKDPPYYDLIDSILGDKHKINPVLLIDSLCNEDGLEEPKPKAVIYPDTPSTSKTCQDEGEECSKSLNKYNNRFQLLNKTVRPKKESLCETLRGINKENNENRNAQFKSLIELIQKQNDQRHEQVMAIIGSKCKQSKKR